VYFRRQRHGSKRLITRLLPRSITIPAGAFFRAIDVTPLDDASLERPETITLTL